MLKYRIGDQVRVLSGKDKGREGKIEKIFPKKGTAIVAGVNVYKKHVKKSVARDGKGGIYDLNRPIRLSKLAVIDPKSNKKTRIGFKEEGGKKYRVAKKSGVIVETK